jgi:hypothetical protein
MHPLLTLALALAIFWCLRHWRAVLTLVMALYVFH